MILFTNQCQRVIQISTNYVSSELENLKSKELKLVQEYDMGNLDELEEKGLSNNINQLIIHFRNYILHNYLRKIRLVDKILQVSDKIFQRNNKELGQLESYLGNLIITLEYIQQKLINYEDLQTLKKQIDNLLNYQIQSTKYQVSSIILDLFNLQVLRDIYLTQFYQKYGIEVENYYKNYRKLSFDLQEEKDPNQINANNLKQEIQNKKQSKKPQQNYTIIISPDTSIPQQQYPISETKSISTKSKSDIRINQLKLHSPQTQGSRSPNSNFKKNYFQSQLKVDNKSIIEQIIQKKQKGQTKGQSYIGNKLNMDQNKQITDYDMFDEQSLFILREYVDSKFASNKIERTNDLAKLINQKIIL